MASTEPLIPQEEETGCFAAVKKCAWTTLKAIFLVLLIIFVLAWIAQFACFYWATMGCSASKLEGYSYPGGGENASFNLMPAIHLLAERTPLWYGAPFDVIPSNEASTVAGAPVGTWWQNPGPIFPIYTYEDVANSQTTVYMRRKLLRLGQSHVIQRCDGKGPVVTFSEGFNYFSNRIRKFFKMNQAMSYKIYIDDTLVAIAEETQQGFQSMTFRSEKDRKELASSVLQDRHFHGQYDLWLVQNKKDDTLLPDYIASATTLLYAFYTLHQSKKNVVAANAPEAHDSPHFLAAMDEVKRINVSAPFTAPLEPPVAVEVPEVPTAVGVSVRDGKPAAAPEFV